MKRALRVTVVDSAQPKRIIGYNFVADDAVSDDEVQRLYQAKYPGATVMVSGVRSNAPEIKPDPWAYDAESNSWIHAETGESCPGFERPVKELPPRDQSGRFAR